MHWQRSLCAAALAAGWTTCAHAQQTSTVAKVEFRNADGFQAADLEAVASIHPGASVSLAQMQAAAQRLADTGSFDDVRMESAGTPKALTLIFLLKPAANQSLTRVTYEDFVWLSPEEIKAAVHGAAPLFSDRLPEVDGTLDAVTKALEAALAAKGVAQPQVEHTYLPATSIVPEPLIAFRVTHPGVRLESVTLAGVPPSLQAKVAGLEQKRANTHLEMGLAATSIEHTLLRPVWDAGYVNARVQGETVRVHEGQNASVQVQLTGTVEPGALYHVGTLTFAPTPVVSAQTFAAGQTLKAGDLASFADLLATEAPVESAYHKLGYMYAYVDPGMTMDAASNQVSYALRAVPGEVYTLRTVTVQGLPPAVRSQFDAAWRLTPGQPYNAEYVSDFLKNNSTVRGLQSYAGSFQAAADTERHQVDLTLVFAQGVQGR